MTSVVAFEALDRCSHADTDKHFCNQRANSTSILTGVISITCLSVPCGWPCACLRISGYRTVTENALQRRSRTQLLKQMVLFTCSTTKLSILRTVRRFQLPSIICCHHGTLKPCASSGYLIFLLLYKNAALKPGAAYARELPAFGAEKYLFPCNIQIDRLRYPDRRCISDGTSAHARACSQTTTEKCQQSPSIL